MSHSRQLVVSIHDVAPPFRQTVQNMLDELDAAGIHERSLLVIPNYHGQSRIDADPEFCEWLQGRCRMGDEVILHGYEHLGVGTPKGLIDRLKNRWCTVGEGEFLSLTYHQATERILQGMAMLRAMHIEAQGFVAPAWLLSSAGLQAVKDLGFQYTNSYLKVVDLANNVSHIAPSLVFGPGSLDEDLSIGMQESLSGFLKLSPIVRIAIHPPCFDNVSRFKRIVSMAKSHLAGRQPVTYLQLLSHLRLPHNGSRVDSHVHE